MVVLTAPFTAILALMAVVPSAFAGRTYSRRSPHFQKAKVLSRQEDPLTSLTLDQSVIMPALAFTGQEGGGDPGQVPALTSTNNFINFCTTQNVPLTDGKQIVEGSCNQTPIGRIAAKNRQPSAKFQFPPNLDTSLTEGQAFTVRIAIKNLQTGNFVNPNANYFANPQTVNGNGEIIGHSHVVIEALPSLTSTEATNPEVFAFFKGLNGQAQGGVLTTDVTEGLPAGAYRACTINTAASHQPCIVAVAQHGALDDCAYFTVNPAGGNNNNNGGGNNNNNGGNNNGGNNNNNNNGGNNNNNNNNNGGNNNNNNGGGNNNNNGGNNNGGGGNNINNNGGSLLQFNEALGGAPPAITRNGNNGFLVQGNRFPSVFDAKERACAIQRNLCGDAANRSGNRNGLDQGACEGQAQRCRGAPTSA